MIIAGIDPGLDGAIAFLDLTSGAIEIADMPTLSLTRNGKGKREIDEAALAQTFDQRTIRHAFVEQVGSMPGQGVSSAFAFGKGYGIVIGCLAAHFVPRTFVSPVRWKRCLGVPADKDGARARASQLLPAVAHWWALVKHDGRAEAALLALYGKRMLEGARNDV